MDYYSPRRSGIPGLIDKIAGLPKMVIILGAFLILVLGSLPLLGIANFTSTNPIYCLTCHGIGDTPDMSKMSLVHPGYDKVKCVDCHAKPGWLVVADGYRSGFKADPEQVSPNCRRCHEKIISNEQVDFKYNVNNIRIPHEFHVKTVGVLCANCHRNIAHDFGEPQTNRPQMEYCRQCHQPNEDCLKCHPQGLPKS
ncbi:MAG: hypothetical protein Q7O66_04045 [Dehalococcoidia bacterium]|nr:hypothetical protein [Dehalococcoidia bacterium]